MKYKFNTTFILVQPQFWSRAACAIVSTPRHHTSNHRAGDVIADWIEANLPEAGPVTGTTSLGSSDWSSFQRLQTASGQRFFVKQARGHAAEAMFNGEALGLTAMYGESNIEEYLVRAHVDDRQSLNSHALANMAILAMLP